MELIIAASIKKAELEPLRRIFSLNIVKIAARKSLGGLGAIIKSSTKISNARLKKISLTSSGGAGRAIFLIEVGAKSVLVMIRLKNDKKIGGNMAIENPRFRKVLNRNLDLIFTDLKNGDYERYNLS